ncbi:MAG: glycosyltransferase [Alphaproteobacteria bacterium]|nr:glycosyltransferase [Alphaproteobacteria bacterium]MBV9370406.1 glycosyltransferase [Alphaproteobacteria bacterium]MBV9900327.1 glycosyltransferase [Alphaproteobacteria bacterium]
MNGGGAERVAVHLLNRQALAGGEIGMGLLRREGPYLEDADQSLIHHRDWGQRLFPAGPDSSFYRPDRLALGAFLAPRVFRSIIREVRPDVVMSFAKGTNLIAWRALAGMGRDRPRWIAREGNNLVRATGDEASGSIGASAAMALTRSAYRAADRVLVNSAELATSLAGTLGLEWSRLRVIHNPVDVETVARRASEPLPDAPPRPYLVSVGRLQPQKGHDLLLRAFAASLARSGHDLVLVGEGPEEGRLRQLSADLAIADRVRFAGFAANPWAWIRGARLFVLPSRWEGFPNALAEALACGTPALSADCRFGPRELLEHGVSGWLVPPEDAEALRDSIDVLTGSPALRSRLAAGGWKRVGDLRIEAILPHYARLFRETAGLARSA